MPSRRHYRSCHHPGPGRPRDGREHRPHGPPRGQEASQKVSEERVLRGGGGREGKQRGEGKGKRGEEREREGG